MARAAGDGGRVRPRSADYPSGRARRGSLCDVRIPLADLPRRATRRQPRRTLMPPINAATPASCRPAAGSSATTTPTAPASTGGAVPDEERRARALPRRGRAAPAGAAERPSSRSPSSSTSTSSATRPMSARARSHAAPPARTPLASTATSRCASSSAWRTSSPTSGPPFRRFAHGICRRYGRRSPPLCARPHDRNPAMLAGRQPEATAAAGSRLHARRVRRARAELVRRRPAAAGVRRRDRAAA